jgi:SAM-dependent methyltransferase
MSMPNSAQIAEWNGEQGRRWVEQQRTLDSMIGPFGQAALQAAAPRPGERVIDIGCGCGSSSIALADAVAPDGTVLAIDVSQPMLDVARAAGAGKPALSFLLGDAANAALPGAQDLLFSRFGLMFFDDPAAALRHLRAALRSPGGRCAFVCWRTPRDNPWAMVPLLAAREALGVTPAAADPLAPGPFAFADDGRLRGLLDQAGFGRIRIERCDSPVATGANAREAAERSMMVGPASRLAREAGPAHAARIAEAMEQALAAHAASDGSISLAGSTWVVTAANAG